MIESHLSEDNYLLQKAVKQKALKRVIDRSKVNFNKLFEPDITKPPHEIYRDSGFEYDEFVVRFLYLYNRPQKDDVIVEYDDTSGTAGLLMRDLGGTGGYLLLRDGYVINQYITRRG